MKISSPEDPPTAGVVAPNQLLPVVAVVQSAFFQDFGAGIGLYVAREVARLHGGTITVTSAPGHGSTFEARLPVAPPAVHAGSPAIASRPSKLL